MFACICRCLTDNQVRQAVNQGACSVREVNNKLGELQCGKCCQHIDEIIKNNNQSANFSEQNS